MIAPDELDAVRFLEGDAMTTNDSEIRALLKSRVDACQAKDIDRLMSLYDDNIVYYDVVPPLQFNGSDEVRGNFLRWFDEYDGPIGLETHYQTVAVGGDVAFANMLHLDAGARKNGLADAIWLRSTIACQRLRGKWFITHEHISVPIRPDRSWVEEGRLTGPG